MKQYKYFRLVIVALLIATPTGVIAWQNRLEVKREVMSFLHKVTGAYAPLNESEILGVDHNIQTRGFASIIHDDNGFRMYYTVRSRDDNKYTINLRQSETLSGFSNAKSKVLFGIKEANVETQVWMPYVFKDKNKYFMYFTARSGDYTTENYIENVRMAISNDGLKWDIKLKPVLEPKLKWEGNEVENWGIIRHKGTYYMSYESRGPSRLQINRGIGIASSKDLLRWTRVKDSPHVSESEYCSSFFRIGKYIYHIVPNNNRFKIYKFTDFENFGPDSFLGYWDPLGKENKAFFDSPDVVTRGIDKTLKDNEEINIFYSVNSKGWRTLRAKYKDIGEFIDSLSEY